MNRLKSILLCIVRLFGVFVVMLIAFVISAMMISTGVATPPEEASQAGIALLVVSLINSLVLAYLILRSHWTGIKLVTAIVLVHFGVETFMTQIETLDFIRNNFWDSQFAQAPLAVIDAQVLQAASEFHD